MARARLSLCLAVSLAAACSASPRPLEPTPATATPSAAPAAAPSTTSTGDPPPPDAPAAAAATLLAPASFAHLVVKVSLPAPATFQNLHYEGFNGLFHQGARDAAEIAARWRRFVYGTAGVFVLRDSLFSQQDYVYRWAPYALMLPPAWIATAVVEVAARRALVVPAAPGVDDDAAWTAVPSAPAMFGSFPPSDGLYLRAHRALAGASSDDAQATRASRATVISLAQAARALAAAAPGGPEAVAQVGAELVSAGDIRYVGASLRYHKLVPILVENPVRLEMVEEGKGFVPPGKTFPDELVALVRRALLRRRLRDGDIAIERYDLSVPADRARAIAVLGEVIPAGDAPAGGKVWLWVTGRLDPSGHTGESAARYLEAFVAELARAPIEHARLRVLGKPDFVPPAGPERAAALAREAAWYRHRDLPLAVGLTTGELRALLP